VPTFPVCVDQRLIAGRGRLLMAVSELRRDGARLPLELICRIGTVRRGRLLVFAHQPRREPNPAPLNRQMSPKEGHVLARASKRCKEPACAAPR
jgi:hypothetical protein